MSERENQSVPTACTAGDSSTSSEGGLLFSERMEDTGALRGILIITSHEDHSNSSMVEVLRREARERRDERFESLGDDTRRGVAFQHVVIREYGITVGDNPSVSAGPPLAIGWEYDGEITLALEEYEEARPERRNGREMIVPRKRREEMFKEAGYTFAQLVRLTKPVNISRNQRRATYASQDLDPWIESYEKVSRKMANVITLGRKKQRERKFLEPWTNNDKAKSDKKGKEQLKMSLRRSKRANSKTMQHSHSVNELNLDASPETIESTLTESPSCQEFSQISS